MARKDRIIVMGNGQVSSKQNLDYNLLQRYSRIPEKGKDCMFAPKLMNYVDGLPTGARVKFVRVVSLSPDRPKSAVEVERNNVTYVVLLHDLAKV